MKRKMYSPDRRLKEVVFEVQKRFHKNPNLVVVGIPDDELKQLFGAQLNLPQATLLLASHALRDSLPDLGFYGTPAIAAGITDNWVPRDMVEAKRYLPLCKGRPAVGIRVSRKPMELAAWRILQGRNGIGKPLASVSQIKQMGMHGDLTKTVARLVEPFFRPRLLPALNGFVGETA